tara:strand:+ start:3283 stop:3573 length:291 start_codon:yes stop_codon:yes gene_type:complete
MKMVIKKSDKPGKKYQAIFTRDNGRTKKTHFGASGMPDYTLTGDKERRRLYRQRHRKDLTTNDPTRAGYLSYYILWGDSKSIRENIKNYKKRFNLK